MPPGSSPDTVQNLMTRFRLGDKQAAGERVALFYPEQRRLTEARTKGEQANHTWQPAGLLNQLHVELLKVKALCASNSDGESERRAFLGLTEHLMWRLCHHSWPLSKRSEKSELEDLPDARVPDVEALSQVDQAFDRLVAVNPNLRIIVELRFFEGLTGKECAAQMGVGNSNVGGYCEFAQQWLEDRFGKQAAL